MTIKIPPGAKSQLRDRPSFGGDLGVGIFDISLLTSSPPSSGKTFMQKTQA